MKTADLYIRVSTDEQADKGYSQRDQAERLEKYCNDTRIAVRKVIFEDHSAKPSIAPNGTDSFYPCGSSVAKPIWFSLRNETGSAVMRLMLII